MGFQSQVLSRELSTQGLFKPLWGLGSWPSQSRNKSPQEEPRGSVAREGGAGTGIFCSALVFGAS